MALTDDITLLSKVPLFEDFNDEMLRLIAFGSERKKVAKNRPLFHEGSSADCAFVVMSGHFKLMQRDRKGKPVQVGEADVGDLLGELAIISSANRKVTAMAEEDSEVMRIHRPMFRRMMEEYPEIAKMFSDRIKRNLAVMLDEITKLSPRFEEPGST
ncbi:cyclic nucleotide-binding domain-containing protein [Hoeflea sp. TYP-13]|uniref:cyclic nucleotide-binding domain-containing protein n=1 Tax=Hoeflea sp. TYP-13 TaxID=3230023 RepID=UPI0034C6B212